MKNKGIVAIQSDPIKTLNFKTDTTILLASEAQRRGFKIFFYEVENLNSINGILFATGKFIKLDFKKNSFIESKKTKINLIKSKYILIRQNPPFNIKYITALYLLENISKYVKIINSPISVRNVHEKLFSLKFIQFMPDTIFTENISDINFFLKKHKNVVLKATHGYGGNQIKLINKKTSKLLISNFIKKHNHVMVQKYIKEIKKGDKRIFIINGKIKGVIKRVPKTNSFLSNMSQGGKAYLTTLSKKDLYISNLIAKDLKKKGIYFCGLDLIGNYLSGDINVTSPTGLTTYRDLSGVDLSVYFWNNLEKK